ncbi:Asparagine--tRNA ligase, cytoplasmic 1 [Sesamum angolense]|uniref:Asparagine--tRNA ligase, cytoplasmic 1 n=1 Tax=Sesamum angolense TaxID=2727404 RepID=A0AAE1VTT1_9LAMI|nr:Asparagine--tRNA ligase, cytoplasmic 1 [Sesamum angolense]
MPRHKLPTHSSRSMVSFMCILLLSQPVIVRVEMLQVTTIISEAKVRGAKRGPPPSESDIKAAELVVKEKGEAVAKTSAKDDMKCAEAYASCHSQEAAKARKFENKVEWGIDLASEHERYLTKEKFKAPVIVYNYPKAKACNVKVNEDIKTVAEMECLYLRQALILLSPFLPLSLGHIIFPSRLESYRSSKHSQISYHTSYFSSLRSHIVSKLVDLYKGSSEESYQANVYEVATRRNTTAVLEAGASDDD